MGLGGGVSQPSQAICNCVIVGSLEPAQNLYELKLPENCQNR